MQPQHAGGQGAEVPLQKASSERSHPLVLSAGRLQNRRLAFGIGGRWGVSEVQAALPRCMAHRKARRSV